MHMSPLPRIESEGCSRMYQMQGDSLGKMPYCIDWVKLAAVEGTKMLVSHDHVFLYLGACFGQMDKLSTGEDN